ncbi:MAG: AbrB/MazE/SpoVT family DNA-binding domain-containing protein [Bacillus sp. (in: Bacteria)]|nr:AbrB/MazE/SpoVT family DNA-binding domain-containing protein [Bacillus sp. (in: firmicutes)]
MEQFERKVTKIGNSFGITLPAELLREVGLSQGDDVQVEVKDGKIILRKKEQINFLKVLMPNSWISLMRLLKNMIKHLKG